MNIGMILDHVFPPDHRVEKEATVLSDAGHNVFLFCFSEKNKKITIEAYKNFSLYKIPTKMQLVKKIRGLVNTHFDFYPFFLRKKIQNFIKKCNIDVIHAHDLYLFGAVFSATKNSNIPIVGDLHENYVDGLKGYRFSTTFPGNILININKWVETEKKWIANLDHSITVIQEMRDRILPQIKNLETSIIVDNSVDIDEFLNYDKNPSLVQHYQNKFVISYIGGFDHHRGIDTLVESLTYLKKYDNIILSLVGGIKNINRIKKIIQERNLTQKVIFEGFKKVGELQNFFDRADVGVIPHLKSVQTDNSSPNKLYQYMLMNTPIISTNCNSVQRIIEDTNSGLIYESGNAKELAEKIEILYLDKNLSLKLGENGSKAVKSTYNFSKSAERLIQLYKKIQSDQA